MTARNLVLYTDGQEATFTDMRQASLAFGRALNEPYRTVTLTEVGLYGGRTIASCIRTGEVVNSTAPCVICGLPHDAAEQHDYETTGARLIMQHEHGNHSQCHQASDCRQKEE